jgi:hypothetical protein
VKKIQDLTKKLAKAKKDAKKAKQLELGSSTLFSPDIDVSICLFPF